MCVQTFDWLCVCAKLQGATINMGISGYNSISPTLRIYATVEQKQCKEW